MATADPATTAEHLGAMPPPFGDVHTMPSHASAARSLLGRGGHGTLTTIDEAGFPYGSLAAYSVDNDATIWVCISELAAHTQNLHRDPKGGLMVATGREHGGDPMNRPRVSVTATLHQRQPDRSTVDQHLAAHPEAAAYVTMPDFSFWSLAPVTARYIGGFGAMSWVDGAALTAAAIDPITVGAAGAVAHMNDDHASANLDMVRSLAGVADALAATMVSLDRLGMTFAVDRAEGPAVARVAFPTPLGTVDEIRPAVIERARAALEE